jgi:flagellar capping protein FliD
MTEHTTIQITKAQADELQERKTHDDESYKSVIARLLDGNSSVIDTGDVTDELMQEIDSMAFNGQMSDEKADRIMNRIDDLETEFKTLRERLER